MIRTITIICRHIHTLNPYTHQKLLYLQDLHLVMGWGNGLREAEEGQSQVDETVFIGLKLLVSLNHLV